MYFVGIPSKFFSVSIDENNYVNSKLYPVVNYFNTGVPKIDCALLCVPTLEDNATRDNIGNLLLKKKIAITCNSYCNAAKLS